MSSSGATKRIGWIDLAKGICIVLVVFNHVNVALQISYPLTPQINSFRMPLYFVLSGLFFKQYEGFVGFLKRKTNKLLIPFLFFLLATSVIPYALLHHELRYGSSCVCLKSISSSISFNGSVAKSLHGFKSCWW